MKSAIAREKQLKTWRRDKNIKLIERQNPPWDDLYLLLFPDMLMARLRLPQDGPLE
jgi:hypothetical protein